MIRLFVSVILGAWAFNCIATTEMSDKSIQGYWGGDRLQLVIEDHRATLEMDCAGGTINTPITLDKAGKFRAPGTFEQYNPAGGPQRADESPAPANARYEGEIKGSVMHLNIYQLNSKTPQKFTLKKDVRVKLFHCL